MASPSGRSSSSDLFRRQYDVFLSFRGADTRHVFTCYLHEFLCRKGIHAFFDEELRRGNDLSALLDRIEQSKISIVVFSENYANSAWCLEELAKIVDCREIFGQVVIPIFYKVSKSDVENQTGNFGSPFKSAEESFPGFQHRVPAWKEALKIASNIAGYVLPEQSPECIFVDKIVKETFKMLNKLSPCETRGLPGIESRVEELEKLLIFNASSCLRTVGVLGMAGIGKTTVADVIYKRNYGLFDGYCFLANIQNESRLHGLDHLQQRLLGKLLDVENLNVGAPDGAHEALKDRLRNKRLFIVLDDVSSEYQVRLLIGQQEWYREGSRILVTTRDKKLLKKIADATYVVPRLNDREALELFCLNAFSNNLCPTEEFMDLSNKFVDYAKGHPLALKLLGSDLCQRDKLYWIRKLERLQTRPDGKIQEVLKLCYEELDPEQKNMFLDISCFFRSEKADFVSGILNSDCADADVVISDLEDKCLVTVSNNRLEMHDLLHTMGKEIGYESSIKEAGKRSRLWNHEDICHVLKYKTGTGEIRGIFLDVCEVERIKLSPDVFSRMWNLKFLKFYNSHCSRECENAYKLHFPEGLDSFPDELVYLHWQGFPLDYLPSNFNPRKLVHLNLRYSCIKQLWEDEKNTENLRSVDLSHSKDLLNLSGLSEAQNLERLNLEGCTSLTELFSSIPKMESIVFLNLRECTSLKSLPKKINLKSLKTLILSGCSNFRRFRIISESIESLNLDGTAIKRIPESIGKLRTLALLNLKNCGRLRYLPNSLGKLKFLRELILSGCSKLESFPDIEEDMERLEILLMDGTAIKQTPKTMFLSNLKTFSFCGSEVQDSTGLVLLPLSGCSHISDIYLTDCNLCKLPDNFCCLSSLQSLCLSSNDIEYLPESIKKLRHLKSLDLKHCRKLNSLPMLPPSLKYLDADDCASLESVAKPVILLQAADTTHSSFIFTDCFKLSRDAQDNIVVHAQLKSQLLANASRRNHKGLVLEPLVSVCFPGIDIPLWFCHQRTGSSMKTTLPPHWCDSKFIGFSLCVVVSFKGYEDRTSHFSVRCRFNFKNEDGESISFSCNIGGWNEPCGSSGHEPRRLGSDHVFISYNNCFHVKKCREENNDHRRCCHTSVSLKFYVTDDARKKLECCEVVRCGMSLLYAPDENDYRLHEIQERNDLDQMVSVSEKEAGLYGRASDEALVSKRGRTCLQDDEIRNGKRVKEEISLY